MTDGEWKDREYPRRSEWEDYFSGHGIEIKRRYIELQNDAHYQYRAKCDEIGLAVRAQTVENTLAMMVEHILEEEGYLTERADQ